MTEVALTRRQRQILDFVEHYRRHNRLSPTLEEIAQHFGVHKVTIFGHVAELERKGMLTRAGRGISRGLQIPAAVDVSRSGIPLIGRIAAGQPIEAVEAGGNLDLSELFSSRDDLYALTVRGDSMVEDSICDGDIVVVNRSRAPCDGDVVVAVLPGEDTTLKRYYRDGNRIRLQPANARYEPILVTEVEVRGVVVGVVRCFSRA
jgi:repressor LexA